MYQSSKTLRFTKLRTDFHERPRFEIKSLNHFCLIFHHSIYTVLVSSSVTTFGNPKVFYCLSLCVSLWGMSRSRITLGVFLVIEVRGMRVKVWEGRRIGRLCGHTLWEEEDGFKPYFLWHQGEIPFCWGFTHTNRTTEIFGSLYVSHPITVFLYV